MRKLLILFGIILSLGLYAQIPGTPNASGVITPGPPDFVTGLPQGDGEMKLQLEYLNSRTDSSKAVFNYESDSSNLFLGYNAGDNIISGIENTGGGFNAFQSEKYGGRNSGYGAYVLNRHIIGSYNVAGGYESQSFGISSYRNSSWGYKTLRVNIVGYDNTAIGYKALQDMTGDNGANTVYTDVGGGKIQVTSAGHGQSNGTTIGIQGTGPWIDHSFTDNYDTIYVIDNVATNTFEITAAFVDPDDLLSLGYWYIPFEGVGNTAVGYIAGSTLRKGSYNLILGWAANVDEPDANSQLSIGNLIKGKMIGTKSVVHDGSYNFGADAQANDDYEINIPAITTLTTGMTITFTANTANTDGATLEITSVGDLDAILKMHDQALATGDIEADQVVVCVFDGTNWQMTSQLAQ